MRSILKVSIIIAILESYEIVRRQIEHFSMMNLSDEVEFIFVDDGSNPPLKGEMKNLKFLYTNDKRPWTQGLARNMGAKEAKGTLLFLTDIDHIITKEAIESVLEFDGDKMVFPRHYGILDEHGVLVNDEGSMVKFGLHPARVRTRRGHLCAGIHGNTYAIRKKIFDWIKGYDSRFCQSKFHVGGRFMSEERKFNNKYDSLIARELVKDSVVGPKIYFFPVGRYRVDNENNPFGLFHKLSLEQVPQPMIG